MPYEQPSRRRSLRRAVRLQCQVQSELWDGELPFLATDLSPHGMWLDSPLPLHPGDRIVVAFRPPEWPAWARPLSTAAKVARTRLHRRRGDRPESGMGLCFAGLDDVMRAALAERLRGLPPPLPGAVAPPLRLSPASPAQAPARSEDALELDDGVVLCFRAEAPLLTAARPATPSLAAPRPRVAARGSYRYLPREQRLGLAETPLEPVIRLPPRRVRLRLVKG